MNTYRLGAAIGHFVFMLGFAAIIYYAALGATGWHIFGEFGWGLLFGMAFVQAQNVYRGANSKPVKKRLRVLDCGPRKIQAIKETRAVTGLGLRESKDFVEGVTSLELPNADVKTLSAALVSIGVKVTTA